IHRAHSRHRGERGGTALRAEIREFAGVSSAQPVPLYTVLMRETDCARGARLEPRTAAPAWGSGHRGITLGVLIAAAGCGNSSPPIGSGTTTGGGESTTSPADAGEESMDDAAQSEADTSSADATDGAVADGASSGTPVAGAWSFRGGDPDRA